MTVYLAENPFNVHKQRAQPFGFYSFVFGFTENIHLQQSSVKGTNISPSHISVPHMHSYYTISAKVLSVKSNAKYF